MEYLALRPLAQEDLDNGFLTLLSQLTIVGDPSPDELRCRFEEIQSSGDYRILVVEDKQRGCLVASGTVFLERKFTHGCRKVGHVEDVVVDGSCRGKGVGKRLLRELLQWAKNEGCYKVILDCEEENVEFYEKCGMSRKDVHMTHYF